MPKLIKHLAILFVTFALQGCANKTKMVTSLGTSEPSYVKQTTLPNQNFSAQRTVPTGSTTTPTRTIPNAPAPINSSKPAEPSRSASPDRSPKPAWVPLEDFAKAYSLGIVQTPTKENKLNLECSGQWNRFRFVVGSRQAFHNGLEFWLGFPVQVVEGKFAVNASDYEKSLTPLANRRQQTRLSPKVIVIDPGHGGENLGTRSIETAGLEKNYTLDWARRLKQLLIKNGYAVYLTRTNDLHYTLPERVAFADKVKADLFVSLHFNSAGNHKDLAGLETYYTTPKGMPSTLTREFEDNPSMEFPNNSFDVENFLLAMNLHRALVEHTGAGDRGVRKARFMGVIRTQTRPSVLIEGGYLSNPAEAKLVSMPAYRQKLAEAIALAIATPYPVESSLAEPTRKTGTIQEAPQRKKPSKVDGKKSVTKSK